MQAIVSLLDPQSSAAVQNMWSELASTFGLRGVYLTPYPHISYHVAQSYQGAEEDTVIRLLQQRARQTRPFTATCSGLGVFTGPGIVLYLPVARSQALARLHQDLWEALAPLAQGAVQHYHPDHWLPHITLAFDDLDHDDLPRVMHLLSSRMFNWELTLDNLCLFTETAAGHEPQVCLKFELEG